MKIKLHFNGMQSNTCQFLLISLVIVIVLRSGDALRPPKTVVVNKCCNAGEKLSENRQCVSDSESDWWPLILMVLKNSFFEPQGSAPKFMKNRQLRPTCGSPEFHIGSSKLELFSNGSLYLSEKHKSIEPQNYCIDRDAAIICDPDAMEKGKNVPKMRKCCGKGAVYFTSIATCESAKGLVLTNGEYSNINVSNMHHNILYGFSECKISKYFAIEETFNESRLNRDTNRIVLQSGRKLVWQDYCLEHVVQSNAMHNISVFTCADHLQKSLSTTDNTEEDIRFILFPIALLISVVFLLLTLATRYLLPANHHHILHWRCQTFYVTCLLIGDFLLAFTQLFGRNAIGFTCISIAVSMHFFLLSAFFWLNTMCINIYWTFRDFRPTSLERSQEKVRLRIYKVYALGVLLLITGTAAAMDFMRKNSSSEDALQPHYCGKEYWFSGDLEKFTFFYGPIGVLLLINFVLFALTARQLTCGLWKREEVKSTKERTTLGRICIKLVFVMGVTWLADILSWAHVWSGGSHYVWLMTDMINALHGVFIFIVIGCQPQVSSVLKQMWRTKNIQFRRRNADGGQNSSSSQAATTLGSITNNTLTTSNAKSLETTC